MRIQTTKIERSQGQGEKIRVNKKQTNLLDWIGQQEGQKNNQHNPKYQQITQNKQGVTNKSKRDKNLDEIRKNREQKIEEANAESFPSLTPSQRLGKQGNEIITFEHINVNGINPHDEFVELQNTMGILEKMEAGVYSIVETQWDTTSPTFSKYIKDTIKREDKYSHIETSSNMDE